MGLSFKSITKPFKKIAKRIKKTSSSIWKGIKSGVLKPLGKLYGKTFGKLGPLGMIAASFILPGLGSMLAAGWTGLAGTLASGASGTFLQAVGTGMQAISTGLSTAGSFVGSITDKIGQVFTKVGGDISTGASNMFKGASEWTKQNLPGTSANLSRVGDFVAKKAQSFGIGGQPASPFNIQADTGSILGAPITLPTGQTLLPAPAVSTNAFNLPTAVQPGSVAGTLSDTGSLLTPEAATSAFNLQADVGSIAQTSISPTGDVTVGSTLQKSGEGSTASDVAKNALKSAASLLQKQGAAPVPVETNLGAADFTSFGSNRLGIGGTGATGGQFLTPQQQAFFQQHAALLGQAG